MQHMWRRIFGYLQRWIGVLSHLSAYTNWPGHDSRTTGQTERERGAETRGQRQDGDLKAMPPVTEQSLPFITRNMLNFEHGLAFALQIKTQSKAAVDLLIHGITREGTFTFRHTTTNDSQTTSSTFRIPDIPIFVSVTRSITAGEQGTTYATLNLLANGNIIQQLITGLVYANRSQSWPLGASNDPRPGGGFIEPATSADPAAGAEANLIVPLGEIWKLKSVHITLVTDATVANRRVHLSIRPTGTGEVQCFATIDQTASTTKLYTFAPYGTITDETDDNDILVNIPPDILLTSQADLITQTVNLQAGDNFGTMRAEVEIFFNPND